MMYQPLKPEDMTRLQLIEQAKLAKKMYKALTNLLMLVESNRPDGYCTEHPSITDARAALDKADGRS